MASFKHGQLVRLRHPYSKVVGDVGDGCVVKDQDFVLPGYIRVKWPTLGSWVYTTTDETYLEAVAGDMDFMSEMVEECDGAIGAAVLE